MKEEPKNIFEIKQSAIGPSGQKVELVYREESPLINLEGKVLRDALAYCFCDGKLVVVYSPDKKSWVPPGGGIEAGESFEDATVREVSEEANMEVVSQEVIGYQDIHEPNREVRRFVYSFCLVRPIGDFKSDPDGDVTEIKLIDPKDWQDYLPNWGEIGERIMTRALELSKVASSQ